MDNLEIFGEVMEVMFAGQVNRSRATHREMIHAAAAGSYWVVAAEVFLPAAARQVQLATSLHLPR